MAPPKGSKSADDSQPDLFGWADSTSSTPPAKSGKSSTSLAPEPAQSVPAPAKAKTMPTEAELDDEATIDAISAELLAAELPAEMPPLGPVIYSVSDLSTELKESLAERFPEILVQGEIADFKGIHRSGHLYFALKDAKSQIRAVMWKYAVQKVPFEIKGGLEVIVTGKIDYYGGSGSLQINVEKMEPVGMGALQLKFEQLKEKLKNEGLFEIARKRKISPVNWRIGLVTGKSTAALQDMLKIFRTRFPLAEIFIFHAAVQGEKAPNEICEAIQKANRYSEQAAKPLDVLIVGRGGGSYEDLFCFNDEKLARTIAASKIPTVSAVGHEIDFTIADMVADKRSATPSHAAQETVPEAALWIDRLGEIERNLSRKVVDKIRELQQRVDTYFNRFSAAAPQKKLQSQKELLKQYQLRFEQLMKISIERRHARMRQLASVLDALSPLKVLDRGYSMVRDADDKVIRSVKEVSVGAPLKLKVADGEIDAQVVSVKTN